MSEAQDRYREVVGHFATGVAVVTATSPAGPVGATTNALTSVSLDPILLLVCLDNGSRTLPVVRESHRFGVNVLRRGQDEIARRFASKDAPETKFGGVPHREEAGVPILEDALAWLACTVTNLLPGGDHTIVVGEVDAMEAASGDPLVWFRGGYVPLTTS